MNSWQFYSKLQQYKDKSTLSHAGLKSVSNLTTGLKNMKNYGYYNKIDNFYGPGKSRYFYSKDEWDAYQDEKNNYRRISEGKDGKITLHDDDTGASKKLNVNWDQFRNGSIMEDDIAIERSLKDGGIKAGINAILRDERMEEFFTQFEGGFENHGWEMDENGKVTGMDDEDRKYIQKMGNWMRKFKDAEGNSLFDSDEFQDAIMKEIRKRYNMVKNQNEED